MATTTTAIRVLIADDDDMFRGALADALRADLRFEVVAVADSGLGIAALAAETAPDVALVDVRMPAGGVEAVTALASVPRRPGRRPIAVVVVSSHIGVQLVASMLRAGAVGYLAKGRLGNHLADLVARSASGEVVLAVPAAVEVLRHLQAEPVGPH